MATVNKSRNTWSNESRRASSLFFARTYGGFTHAQEQFYRTHLGPPQGKRILDPMGGQGYTLSALAGNGCHILLGDINPAPLHLAMLRDPRMILERGQLVEGFKKWFSSFKPARRKIRRTEYLDDWISPDIKQDLQRYVSKLGLESDISPFSYNADFWSIPLNVRFAASLPILAARALSCFRGSDNVTWLKKGGLVRERELYGPVMHAVELWAKYAADLATTYSGPVGTISTRRMDVEHGRFGRIKTVDAIITSPPYANRLDYTRMWAPELEVLSTMWGNDSTSIKNAQIGSTVVEGKTPPSWDDLMLPSQVRQVLSDIRLDDGKASDTYYYPFFRNYAISIARSLPYIVSKLAPGGLLVFFVRDTVRKDIMFPTGDLISSIVRKLGCRLVQREKHILRHHVGFLRKSSAGGMYGLAQLEWWLAFRKG